MINLKTKPFVFFLALLMAIMPFSIDAYLPSFVFLSKHFLTNINNIELTLATYILGVALGMLIFGPLSDRYGRKIFILSGLTLYIIFSISIVFSITIEQILILRFLQGFGVGIAVVNVNAIVKDVYEESKTAKIFSILTLIMLSAPLIAPFIGSTILFIFSNKWQYIFVFLTIYGFIVLLLFLKMPETSPKTTKNIYGGYLVVLKNKITIFAILAGTTSSSGLFIYLIKSPYIYMDHFNFTSNQFPMLFSSTVIFIMIVIRINIILLKKYTPLNIFGIGILCQLISSATLLLLYDQSIYFVFPLIVFYVASLGIIMGNVLSVIMANNKNNAGAASALYGNFNYLMFGCIGFLSSYIAGLFYIFIFMLGVSSLAFLLYFILRKLCKFSVV